MIVTKTNYYNEQETMTVIYPQMVEEFTPKYLNLLFAHLDSCKDVCDHFGITTTLVPYKQKGKIVGFTVKSFKNPSSTKDGEDNYNFKYDPFWDDGTDFESLYAGVDDEDIKDDPYPTIENKIPNDDEEIISITKSWVNAVMTDMGICPFTQGPDKAGLPIGNVFYCVDRSTGFEDIYAKYWKEVVRIERNPEKDIATTLLITPEFCLDNVELFDSFTTTLTQPLVGLKIEELLQLVFFHPDWSFRDGSARTDTSSGKAANYARRSPWPMINILRTKQVRAAQKGIPTGLVYKQNEKTLSKVGVDKLETMLRLRDWTDTADYKVNRREYDALKIAQDYQTTGTVDTKDTNLYDDSTPAANKVNRQQVEQGNLVNVIIQALEKRLGKSKNSATISPLSGPETSATAMATDVLIQELLDIAEKKSSSSSSATTLSSSTTTTTTTATQNKNVNNNNDDEEEIPIDIILARQKRLEDARRAILGDNEPNTQQRQQQFGQTVDPMTDAMFGTGGITKQASVDDELFSEGMDPRSFY
jgi:hypothetical protein